MPYNLSTLPAKFFKPIVARDFELPTDTSLIRYAKPNGSTTANCLTEATAGEIQTAINATPANGVCVLLGGGVYRTNNNSTPLTIPRKMTIQNRPGDPKAVISGAQVIASSAFTETAVGSGVFYAPWTQSLQNVDSNYYAAATDHLKHCQQLYVGNVPLEQVGSIEELTATSFYYDPTAGAQRMYIKQSPTNKTIEATKVNYSMTLYATAAAGSTIRNITFEKARTSLHVDMPLSVTGNAVFINHCIFQKTSFAGLHAYTHPAVSNIANCIFFDNGEKACSASRVIFEQNEVARSNWKLYNKGWDAGGIKITTNGREVGVYDGVAIPTIVSKNYFYDNDAFSCWIDNVVRSAVVKNNLFDGNRAIADIKHEVCIGGRIFGNFCQNMIDLSNTKDNWVFHNTVIGNPHSNFRTRLEGIEVRDTTRTPTSGTYVFPEPSLSGLQGWELQTENNRIWNNLLVATEIGGKTISSEMYTRTGFATTYERMVAEQNYNHFVQYSVAAGKPIFHKEAPNPVTNYLTIAEWRADHPTMDANSTKLSLAAGVTLFEADGVTPAANHNLAGKARALTTAEAAFTGTASGVTSTPGAVFGTAVTTPVELPTLSISDVSVAEGNSGTTNVIFTIRRQGDTTGTSSVTCSTVSNTATAGTDFVTKTATISFAAGETSKTFTVVVNADTVDEPNELFYVDLSNPVNATITDVRGVGTITNDDAAVAGPTLEEQLAAATTRIQELEGTVAAQEQALAEAATENERITGLYNQAISDRATLQSFIDNDLQPRHDALVIERNNLQASLTQANLDKTNLTNSLNAVTTERNNLQVQLSAANNEITRLTGLLTTANANVTTLTGQLNTANSEIARLEAELAAAIDATPDSLQAQLAAVTASRDNLQIQLNTANSNVTTLTGQLAQSEEDKQALIFQSSTLQSQLTSANATNQALAEDVSDLNEEISVKNNQIATANFQIGSLNTQLSATSLERDSLRVELEAIRIRAQRAEAIIDRHRAALSDVIAYTESNPSQNNT